MKPSSSGKATLSKHSSGITWLDSSARSLKAAMHSPTHATGGDAAGASSSSSSSSSSAKGGGLAGIAPFPPPVAHFDPYAMEIESDNFPREIPAFIEVSAGSRNKYEYDHDLGALRLDRVLHSAVYYPHDYGFIPQTICGDNDPLDILVMSTAPLVPGCVVQARPIAYMIMEDEKGQDEKVLAVNAHDAHFNEIRTMRDLHEHTLREISEFFSTYKRLEKDKWAVVSGWKSTEDTLELIKKTHKDYLAKLKSTLELAP